MCGKNEEAKNLQPRQRAEVNDWGRQKNSRNDLLIQSCWIPVAKSGQSIWNKNCQYQSVILLDELNWLEDYLSFD